MEALKRNKWIIVGVLAGAIGGYMYYHFVGCASGTCAITSKPLNSTIYGAIMGGLLVSLFTGDSKKSKTKHNE